MRSSLSLLNLQNHITSLVAAEAGGSVLKTYSFCYDTCDACSRTSEIGLVLKLLGHTCGFVFVYGYAAQSE